MQQYTNSILLKRVASGDWGNSFFAAYVGSRQMPIALSRNISFVSQRNRIANGDRPVWSVIGKVDGSRMDGSSQKMDDSLALALSVQTEQSAEQLEGSSLFDGYDRADDIWELIVKYSGDLTRLASEEVIVEPLLAGYAIVTLPARLVRAFAALPQIEYIEQPKRLLPQIREGLQEACFLPVLRPEGGGLSGNGVLLAIIDSGIDYTLDLFRNADGSTRIVLLYDQATGTQYDANAINESLGEFDRSKATGTPFVRLTQDVTGHGTKVAAIAASGAPAAGLVIVKLDTQNQSSYPLTSNLMRAFTYVVRQAQQMGLPVAVNLSYGNTYGSHEGTSLLERFIDNAAEVGRSVFCVGMGNEGASDGHYTGNLKETENGLLQVSFAVGSYERTLSLQIWSYPSDRYEAVIVAPSGERHMIPAGRGDGERESAVLSGTQVLIFSGTAKPYRTKEELYLSFAPTGEYIDTGIWQIILIPVDIKYGQIQMYLPAESIRSSATRFLRPDPYGTVTIPATASKVISVGAYRGGFDAYASFSGRGNYSQQEGERLWQIAKPDLVALGVGVTVPGRFGPENVSGTSYATPFVTAAAALLMEWGIVKENDPYLYGEKVKAYLQYGAIPLDGEEALPSALTGWGRLCVQRSIPERGSVF